jgi:hypothetical protein
MLYILGEGIDRRLRTYLQKIRIEGGHVTNSVTIAIISSVDSITQDGNNQYKQRKGSRSGQVRTRDFCDLLTIYLPPPG